MKHPDPTITYAVITVNLLIGKSFVGSGSVTPPLKYEKSMQYIYEPLSKVSKIYFDYEDDNDNDTGTEQECKS